MVLQCGHAGGQFVNLVHPCQRTNGAQEGRPHSRRQIASGHRIEHGTPFLREGRVGWHVHHVAWLNSAQWCDRALKRVEKEPLIRYLHQSFSGTLDDFLARNRTTGLLVLKGDTILVERYQYERKPGRRMNSYSMAKTVVAMLVGIARAARRLLGALHLAYLRLAAGEDFPRAGACPHQACGLLLAGPMRHGFNFQRSSGASRLDRRPVG